MSRLHRSLWHVEARFPDRLALVPTWPVEYDVAALIAPLLGDEGATTVILRRVPESRAPWEFRAAFEASDPPRW